jgi:hypothetical protein
VPFPHAYTLVLGGLLLLGAVAGDLTGHVLSLALFVSRPCSSASPHTCSSW